MTYEKFNEIVDFILENRGSHCFSSMSKDDIMDYVMMAMNTDTIVVHKHGQAIDGVMCWEILNYIPMKIEITQCIAKGKHVLLDMATEFKNLVPISFRCFARRKSGIKTSEYKNPSRILKLMKILNMEVCHG